MGRKGESFMNKQKELAVKVMKFANEFTHWNFQMEKEGNIYIVGTTLSNDKGQETAIYYLIGEGCAELKVVSVDNKYDYGFLKRQTKKIAKRYPIYVMGVEGDSISINSPILLEVLERDMADIISKRMVDMLQAMTDILNYDK